MTHLFLFDRLFPTYNKKIQELLWQTRKSLFLENKKGLYKYPLNRSFRDKRSVLQSRYTNRNIKRLAGVLPIRIVKSNVSSVGPFVAVSLWRRANAWNVRLSVSAVLLYYPYRQYYYTIRIGSTQIFLYFDLYLQESTLVNMQGKRKNKLYFTQDLKTFRFAKRNFFCDLYLHYDLWLYCFNAMGIKCSIY